MRAIFRRPVPLPKCLFISVRQSFNADFVSHSPLALQNNKSNSLPKTGSTAYDILPPRWASATPRQSGVTSKSKIGNRERTRVQVREGENNSMACAPGALPTYFSFFPLKKISPLLIHFRSAEEKISSPLTGRWRGYRASSPKVRQPSPLQSRSASLTKKPHFL